MSPVSMRFALLAALALSACLPPRAVEPAKDAGVDSTTDLLGTLDGIDGSGVVSGWALSRARSAQAIEVELFVDGDSQPLATVTASEVRADVTASTGVPGNHGFRYSLPATLKDGAAHHLRAYGVGPLGRVELGHSPASFTLSPPACSTAGPLVAHTEDEYVVTLRADNGKLVLAECGGDDVGLLRADGDTAGEWGTFFVQPRANGEVSIRSSHGRLLSAEGAGGGEVHANRTALGPWELFHLDGTLAEGATISLRAADGAHFLSARTELTPPTLDARATSVGPRERFTVHVESSPIRLRRGVVRAEGRSFVDDDGPFYPLGGTLFWALYGWKNDRDRVKQNLQFLARHHYDFVRILAEVDWAGQEIDPAWPDYQQALGELIDYAYDTCGLRTELTLMGGRGDPMVTAQKVVPVVTAGRQHKVLDLEVANESYGRPVTLAQLQAVGRFLRQNVPNLVALSSGEGLASYAPGSTDWRTDYVAVYLPSDAANLGTIHMDRGFGDDGWRACRQPWDWKDFAFPISHNEPIGPRSSVAEEVDPVRLAMLRAVGLINGVEAFVLHNGAGVFGRVDPARNRPANLWEVPNIDAIMKAVRGVAAFLPPRVGDGTHWNNAWAGNPWVADAIWSDGAAHGVNRNYTVSTADGWVSTEAGVKDHVVLTATRHSLVEVYDVLQGKVQEVELPAGGTLSLTPVSRDSFGYGAFIIVGHYR